MAITLNNNVSKSVTHNMREKKSLERHCVEYAGAGVMCRKKGDEQAIKIIAKQLSRQFFYVYVFVSKIESINMLVLSLRELL